jgi:hypothetical protein
MPPKRPKGHAVHAVEDPVLYKPTAQGAEDTLEGQALPGGQGVHAHSPVPFTANVPAGHWSPFAWLDPGPQNRPVVATHAPVHDDDARPVDDPNLPVGQGAHATAPEVSEYRPSSHITHAVTLRAPPYVPGAHSPLHKEEFNPAEAPHVPAGHTVHDDAKAVSLYKPAGHGAGAPPENPVGQYWPGVAAHGPAQAEVVNPVTFPSVPAASTRHVAQIIGELRVTVSASYLLSLSISLKAASHLLSLYLSQSWNEPGHILQTSHPGSLYLPTEHAALQPALARPVLEPYPPAGHGVQEVALPTALYEPRSHTKPVGRKLPGGQYDPAMDTHTPLHVSLVSPLTEP